MSRLHEDVIGPGPEQINFLDDLSQLLDPDVFLDARGFDLGIEKEGSDVVSADGEDQDVLVLEIGMVQQVPVVSLIVEDEERFVMAADLLEKSHGQGGLAAPGLAEQPDVLQPVAFLDPEFANMLTGVCSLADRIPPIQFLWFDYRQQNLVHDQAGQVFGQEEIDQLLQLFSFPEILLQQPVDPKAVPLPRWKDWLQQFQFLLDLFRSHFGLIIR